MTCRCPSGAALQPESLGLGAMAKSSSLNIRVVEGRALPAKDV